MADRAPKYRQEIQQVSIYVLINLHICMSFSSATRDASRDEKEL